MVAMVGIRSNGAEKSQAKLRNNQQEPIFESSGEKYEMAKIIGPLHI